jgi:adenylate cyclase
MKGLEYIHRHNKKDNSQARQFLKRAIELDEQYSMPLACMALTYFTDLMYGWSDNALETFDLARQTVTKALELNASLDIAHSVSGFLLLFTHEHDKALLAGEKAISLNPNGAHAHLFLSYIYWMCGKSAEAVLLMEKAFRLNPIPLPLYYSGSAMAYRFNQEYDKAIEMAKKAIAKQPDMLMSHLVLTASYSEAGMLTKAAAAAKEVIKIHPDFSLESYSAVLPYKQKKDIDRYIGALRKAGLPD